MLFREREGINTRGSSDCPLYWGIFHDVQNLCPLFLLRTPSPLPQVLSCPGSHSCCRWQTGTVIATIHFRLLWWWEGFCWTLQPGPWHSFKCARGKGDLCSPSASTALCSHGYAHTHRTKDQPYFLDKVQSSCSAGEPGGSGRTAALTGKGLKWITPIIVSLLFVYSRNPDTWSGNKVIFSRQNLCLRLGSLETEVEPGTGIPVICWELVLQRRNLSEIK